MQDIKYETIDNIKIVKKNIKLNRLQLTLKFQVDACLQRHK